MINVVDCGLGETINVDSLAKNSIVAVLNVLIPFKTIKSSRLLVETRSLAVSLPRVRFSLGVTRLLLAREDLLQMFVSRKNSTFKK